MACFYFPKIDKYASYSIFSLTVRPMLTLLHKEGRSMLPHFEPGGPS